MQIKQKYHVQAKPRQAIASFDTYSQVLTSLSKKEEKNKKGRGRGTGRVGKPVCLKTADYGPKHC